MKSVTFSELRNSAKKYFDTVEKGETLEVHRHGKPLINVVPAIIEGAVNSDSRQAEVGRAMRLQTELV